jgi:HSP20 family molecular chaperone IbpA
VGQRADRLADGGAGTDLEARRVCDFGCVSRSLHFPEKIDPNSAKAEYQNSMVRLTAAIAKAATAQKAEIKAA